MASSTRFIMRLKETGRSLPLLAVLASAGLAMPAMPASAENTNAEITKEQASQNALQAMPGKVTDITVERKLGKNVYVVEIVADKGGDETDVLVDMSLGKVLGVEK